MALGLSSVVSSELGSALAAPESLNWLRPILSRLGIVQASLTLPSLLQKVSILTFSSDGVTSWYDFAKMIAKMAGHIACDIQPCHSDEYPSPVKRPAYSVLDKTKIKETFGVSVPYWTDSLKVCIDNLLNNPFRVER